MTPFERYHRTIDFLRRRSRAYQITFQNPEHNEVLKDLAKFCRAGKSAFHMNQRMTDVAIGRQEVFQRIMDHLKLQPDQLYAIYNTPSIIQPPTAKENTND